jgi:hypothetical protein
MFKALGSISSAAPKDKTKQVSKNKKKANT